ncbi:hypothetical protein [Streptomyces sp. NPDC006477]|uniref:hypothetical protein n=1 Tax=Streptomyces sp. NPDC006477 TaxID=3364747 RepID=UPI0036B71D51
MVVVAGRTEFRSRIGELLLASGGPYAGAAAQLPHLRRMPTRPVRDRNRPHIFLGHCSALPPHTRPHPGKQRSCTGSGKLLHQPRAA